jgi:hypothetical protein
VTTKSLKVTTEELAAKYNVPFTIIESLDRYVDHRVPTGGFLNAVLANDLRESCARADWDNRSRIFEITNFCYNEIPAICWGSYEKVDEWLKRKS